MKLREGPHSFASPFAYLVILPLAFLSACSSVSLKEPQRPISTPAPVVTAPASPAPPTVVLSPNRPPVAVANPIPSPGSGPAATGATPALAPSVTGSSATSAIDARFPTPATVYNTPGLAANRTTYTSANELRAWLASLTSLGTRSGALNAAVLDMGRSQQGQPLDALVMTQDSDVVASVLVASPKPTVVFVAGQHGDAPASTEAALVLARELAQGSLRGMLEQLNVIVVPRANPDGAVSGTALASNGVDIATDHVRLSTLEAQAIARLLRDYRPAVVVDVGEYQAGSKFIDQFGVAPSHDLLLQYSMTANMPEFLTRADEEWFRRPLVAALDRELLTNEWYYTTGVDTDNTTNKTFAMGSLDADSLRNVAGLRNSIGFTIASRGVGIARQNLQRRVHSLMIAMTSILRSTASKASELAQLRPYLDREVAQRACRDEASLGNVQGEAKYNLTMLDPVTGRDKLTVVDWKSSLDTTVSRTRIRACGYWLSASSVNAVQRLRQAGVQVMKVAETGSVIGDFYRRGPAAVGGLPSNNYSLQRGLIDMPAGSFYVPMNQAWGNLALVAMEPDMNTSFVATGVLPNTDAMARLIGDPNARMDPVP